MTQLELSYIDEPLPVSEDSHRLRLRTPQFCLEIHDPALCEQVAANQETVTVPYCAADRDAVAISDPGCVAVVGFASDSSRQLLAMLRDNGINALPLASGEGHAVMPALAPFDLIVLDSADADRALRWLQSWNRHPSSANRAVLVHGIASSAERCQLLEAGATDVIDAALADQEKLVRCRVGARRVQTLETGSVASAARPTHQAMELLSTVGRTLFATAQRGHISLVVAVMRLSDMAMGEQPDIHRMMIECQCNLRETDFFARSAANEFVVVITNATRHNVGGILERLAELIVAEAGLPARVPTVQIGMTLDLGVSFESMIERARVAAHNASDPQQLLNTG